MISQDQKIQIIKLYRDGFSSLELGKLFNLAHTTILYHVKNPDKIIVHRSKKGGKNYGEKTAWERQKMLKAQREIKRKVAKTYADYIREAQSKRVIRNEIGEGVEALDV